MYPRRPWVEALCGYLWRFYSGIYDALRIFPVYVCVCVCVCVFGCVCVCVWVCVCVS